MRTQRRVSGAPASAWRCLRDAEGLTLVETLIALALLMFGILALFGPMHYATLSLWNAKEAATAIEIATSRMELVNIDPPAFFAQAPLAQQPPRPLTQRWHDSSLDLDFGEIAGHPNMACYVILESNLVANNTALVRIPVVWQRIGGRYSTVNGLAFDPNNPDTNPASIELRTVVQY